MAVTGVAAQEMARMQRNLAPSTSAQEAVRAEGEARSHGADVWRRAGGDTLSPTSCFLEPAAGEAEMYTVRIATV